MRGVFILVDTHGIPLEIVLDRLRDRRMMPDWLDYYDSSVKSGVRPDRALLRLTSAVGDVYGPRFREGWEKALREILEWREK